MADGPVIGIDLGTTNSVVATVHEGQPVLIKNRTGHNLTPSIVAVTAASKRVVGQLAKRQSITNPEGTVYASKRLIGRKFSSEQVQRAVATMPYHVVAGQHDDVRIQLGGMIVSLPEISAAILRELKLDAEAHFGTSVSQAVVTVPAYFNDGQRQATKDAGRIAGLDVLRILNEPTAAALAYGFGKSVQGKIAVFDLGGGTFDVSVMEVNQGVFEVLATGGDTYLGGEDFDNRIIDWLVMGFATDHGVDLRKDRMALQRLKDAAERAKIELSSARETHINLPFLCTPQGAPSALHLQATLSREKLETLTADLCQKTLAIADAVLDDAKVRVVDLKEIILVGGMTRMPRLVEMIKAHFKRDPCKGVHPEEVVALGAAIQANSLVTPDSQVLLLDVTPQSLGVAIAGGYSRTLIPRNTTVPTATTESFTTSKDNQTSVKIMVLQGESEIAHLNEHLGEFVLTGLRQAARGQVEIEVAFDINSEGIVSVSARDKETGQLQSITVTASGGLTQEELAKLMAEDGGQLMDPVGPGGIAAKKQELSALMTEVQGLFAQLQSHPSGESTAGDALRKSKLALDVAKTAHAKGGLEAITNAQDQLLRTRVILQGALGRMGPA